MSSRRWRRLCRWSRSSRPLAPPRHRRLAAIVARSLVVAPPPLPRPPRRLRRTILPVTELRRVTEKSTRFILAVLSRVLNEPIDPFLHHRVYLVAVPDDDPGIALVGGRHDPTAEARHPRLAPYPDHQRHSVVGHARHDRKVTSPTQTVRHRPLSMSPATAADRPARSTASLPWAIHCSPLGVTAS